MSAARTLKAKTPLTVIPAKPSPRPKPKPLPRRPRPDDAPLPAAQATMQRRRDAALESGDVGRMLHAEASAYPLLTAAQQRALARRARAGDKDARDTLITRNIRLVECWALRLSSSTALSIDDLTGAGMLGLIRAVEKFDPESGYKFATYASWWIRQAIGHARDEQESVIRVPTYGRVRQRTLVKLAERFLKANGREASDEELLAAFNARAAEQVRSAKWASWNYPMTLAGLRELRRAALPVTSLYDPRYWDDTDPDLDGSYVLTGLADPAAAGALDATEDGEAQQRLAALLQEMLRADAITAREVCVLARRYALKETLEQVGSYLGLTRERVRQLQKSGQEKLQAELARRGVSSYAQWVSEGSDASGAAVRHGEGE